jgi:hypothetical protein
MKKLSVFSLIFSFLFILSCEDKKDTTPPEVTITSPSNDSKVNEVVTVTCMSTDNKEVTKVELWIDGQSTGLIDETEPYSFKWNTTEYKDGDHTLIVRGYDSSENEGDSPPVKVNVDNTISVPVGVSVKSVSFLNGGFSIDWSKSTDGDFKSYSVEHSIESGMEDYEEIFSTEDVSVTSTRMENTSPLSYHYFRVTVTDTFLYQTKGSIYSSSLDPIPDSVDVKSVIYDLEKMTVEWEESKENDFGSYKLLYSKIESGNKDTIETYTDKNTISYSTSTYDPTIENWYWVIVSDTLGQYLIGNGKTNTIDSPPKKPELIIKKSNDNYLITWSKDLEEDFSSYKLYESKSKNGEELGEKTLLIEGSNSSDTTYTKTNLSDQTIYYVQVTTLDKWGQETKSDIESIENLEFLTFGGSDYESGGSIQQTTDGGYIITGITHSFGNGSSDIWLIKTDSQGVEEWNRTFGGDDWDEGHDVQQTSDGGYIITGQTKSFGNGYSDVWLIKTDSQGVEEWSKTFGGSENDYGFSVQQTTDGGYIITGRSGNGNYNMDVILIKTSSDGSEEWSKYFGGIGSDGGNSIQITNDGGYVIIGETSSFGNGDSDVWLIKTNSQGQEEWNKTFGETGYSVQQTSDGGYIITGQTKSFGNGDSDVWLIKTNSEGVEEWNKTFGGGESETGYSVQQTSDGGYILTGITNSYGKGKQDLYLIKTNSEGVEEWSKTFGGSENDYGFSVQQTTDGGYIITGNTESFGKGLHDVWLIITDSNGNLK